MGHNYIMPKEISANVNKLIELIGSDIEKSPYKPDHWHDVIKDENDKVRVAWTPGCGNKARLIYVFRNKEDNHLLIGKTGQMAKERLYGYHSDFSREIDDEDDLYNFPKEVRDNPKNFQWAILTLVDEKEELDDWETAFVIAFRTLIPNGYNKTTGSNGSECVPKKPIGPDTPTKHIDELLDKAHIYEFYQDDEGFFHCDMGSPTAKKESSKVYAIMLEKKMVYSGKTDQALSKRFYGHFHNARKADPEDERGGIYPELKKAKKGKVALLHPDTNSPERHEKKVDRLFQEAGYQPLNVAKPGGGGASKKRKQWAAEKAAKVARVLFPPTPEKSPLKLIPQTRKLVPRLEFPLDE